MAFQKYSLFLFLLIGLIACEPSIDDKTDIGPTPTPSFEIVTTDNPNEFILKNTTVGAFMIFWELEGTSDREGQEVLVNFPFSGSYAVKMTAFNKGGSASTSQSVSVSQDDPNACFGNFKMLTGCGEKVWRMAPESNAMLIGPSHDEVWWGNSDGDVAERTCHFNDEYIFRSNGEFMQDTKGDFWADSDGADNVFPADLGVPIGCHSTDAYPEAYKAWGSGLYSFTIGENSLTVVGDGAWIGLYKVGSTDEVSVPQSSITYTIESISDNRMVLFTDFGWAVWKFVLVSE
ncbi:MAG: hypothetical protein AB8B69_09845 [Chitinophagales bacterium]